MMDPQGYSQGDANQQDAFGAAAALGGPGMQYAVNAGRQFAEGFLSRMLNVSDLRRYFAVSTDYVKNKLKLILFPYTYHGTWKRATLAIEESMGCASVTHPPPRGDINAPDLYIPLMGFITYIVFCAMVAGFSGVFSPEILGIVGTKALVIFGLDAAVLWVGYYLLSNGSQPLWDCVAMCGYVFVGIALNELAQMIGGRWFLYPCLIFTGCGVATFLSHSVRVVLASDPSPASDNRNSFKGYPDSQYMGGMGGEEDPSVREHYNRRYFVLFLAFLQFLVMYLLAFSPVVEADPNNPQKLYDRTQNTGNNQPPPIIPNK